jgi:hypothetical protein
MKRMSLLLGFLLLLPCLPLASAQTDVPDSAIAEIIRRGDLVTRTGDGLHGSATEKFTQAVDVPEDDSHKWFISVITSPGCQACEKLKADWRKSPVLRAFANPDDPKESWAHYHVYRSDDTTQSWRWKNLRISGYPTILIQPPGNRQFGDPSTVVMQCAGYEGDAKQLSGAMSTAIRKYVERVTKNRRAAVAPEDGNRQALSDASQATGYDPPFTPITPDVNIPPVAPFLPNQPVVIPPVPEPQVTPNAVSLLFEALGGTLASKALPSLLLIVLIGVQVWRAFRKSTNQPLLLDDEAFERIRELILSLLPSEDKPTSPPSIRS